jgi:chitinase
MEQVFMRPSRIVARAAAALVIAGGLLTVSGSADAATAPALPEHVFAPYFETFNTDSTNKLAALSRQSGDKFVTLAFLQTPAPGSCTVDWNGKPETPVASSIYGADISAIRATGGDVVPSFGGGAADGAGTELADSCTSVDKIAAEFERVITTYGVSRIDLDIEGKSQDQPAAIDRRNKAIRKVEAWAAASGRRVQFVYTLPIDMIGLEPDTLSILQNAVDNGTRVDAVNIMTFDYYDEDPTTGLPSHEMADDTKTTATILQSQLATLWPAKTADELWRMTSVTEMIGQDDFGPPETLTLADARSIADWAARQHLAGLSMWALERDNGNCPVGSGAVNNCSSIAQTTWQFSDIMRDFTAGATSAISRSWLPNVQYKKDDVVTYQGTTYTSRQAHRSQTDWNPTITPALWSTGG